MSDYRGLDKMKTYVLLQCFPVVATRNGGNEGEKKEE